MILMPALRQKQCRANKKNSLFTERWQQQNLIPCDLIYWWTGSSWLKAEKMYHQHVVLKNKINCRGQNEGAL